MSTSQSLQARIQEKMKAADEQIDEHRREFAREMEQREQHQRQFLELTARLVPDVVEPRLASIAEIFPDATLESSKGATGRQWVWTFPHTERFPASVQLRIAVQHADREGNLLLHYSLEILPIFFQFERHHQLALPLNAIEDDAVAGWIEDRILEFVDVYLQVGQTEQYQREVLVADPVCGMQITPRLAVRQEEFGGKAYYFCSEPCAQQFREDPGRFVVAAGEVAATSSGVKTIEASQQAQAKHDQQELDQLDNKLHDLKSRIDKKYGND